ncbi:OmpA family protein [Mesorhizobium sp. WSM2239]|uniref:OmpA family protein n=2 Tax=unclassified Mesorhizobium TaxID=325217 RepID=A0AAU8DHQ2_9HYPH
MRQLLMAVFWMACFPGVNDAVGVEAQSEVTVEVAGEAYKGAPVFEVRFDGVVVGSGTLKNSIDTAAEGRLFETKDPLKYVETFQFKIPDDVFSPSGVVEISFTNDAWGGDSASQADRNLFARSISVNGKKIDAAELRLQNDAIDSTPEAIVGAAETHGFVALPGSDIKARAMPGGEGWPQPSQTAESRALPTDPAGKMAPGQADGEVQPAPSVTTASKDKASDCDRVANVAGFQNNSAELSTAQRSALDKLISELADEPCALEIIGYASNTGTASANERVSQARAAAVADYLTARGIPAASATTIGKGQTMKFGPSAIDNQRVVITTSKR